jgi:hypothetical protein
MLALPACRADCGDRVARTLSFMCGTLLGLPGGSTSVGLGVVRILASRSV